MNYKTMIGARQIRAARALLDWSQEDLAQATDLSIATIRKLELGYISPRSTTTSTLQKALETAGVEFTDSDGVRRRPEDVRVYRGDDGCRHFLDALTAELSRNGGDLLCLFTSKGGFSTLFGTHPVAALDAIIDQARRSNIQLLLPNLRDLPLSTPRIQFRSFACGLIDPMSFIVFGDKYALVITESKQNSRIVVVQSIQAAQAARRQFSSVWDNSPPLHIKTGIDSPEPVLRSCC